MSDDLSFGAKPQYIPTTNKLVISREKYYSRQKNGQEKKNK